MGLEQQAGPCFPSHHGLHRSHLRSHVVRILADEGEVWLVLIPLQSDQGNCARTYEMPARGPAFTYLGQREPGHCPWKSKTHNLRAKLCNSLKSFKREAVRRCSTILPGAQASCEKSVVSENYHLNVIFYAPVERTELAFSCFFFLQSRGMNEGYDDRERQSSI